MTIMSNCTLTFTALLCIIPEPHLRYSGGYIKAEEGAVALSSWERRSIAQ